MFVLIYRKPKFIIVTDCLEEQYTIMDNNNQPNNNQNNNQNNQNQGGGNGPQKKQSLFMLMIAVLFTLMFMSFVMRFLSGGSNEISYSAFLNMVRCGQVESVLITDDQIKIAPKKTEKEVSGNALFGDYGQNSGQTETIIQAI